MRTFEVENTWDGPVQVQVAESMYIDGGVFLRTWDSGDHAVSIHLTKEEATSIGIAILTAAHRGDE